MISKRGKGLKLILSFVILIALLHGTAHIILFKTNISIVKSIGLSGRAVGETNTDNIEYAVKQNTKMPLPSMLLIGGEWILIFSLITLSVIKKRLTTTIEKTNHIELVKKKNKSDTDIDLLYEMLKRNKRLPLSRLAELFKVDKKVIEEWGKILEESGMAVVDYPRFGEIEIILKDEEAPKS